MFIGRKFAAIYTNGWRYLRGSIIDKSYTNAMCEVCGIIAQNPGCKQDFLVRILGLDKGAVARTVQRCVDSGLTLREVNPNNHREVQLYPTDEGKKLVDTIGTVWLNWQDEVLSVLPQEDRESFLELVNLISEKSYDLLRSE